MALLRPRVIIPAVLSIGLLAGIVSVADLPSLERLLAQFKRVYAVYFIGLMVLYEAIRGVQWAFLLKGLGVRARIDVEAFSFLVGEMTRSVPIGNYFQNYLLQRIQGSDFGRTSAASTLVILLEVAVSLAGVVIIGVDDWNWLRPVIVVGLGVAALVGWAIVQVADEASAPQWLTRRKAFRTALEEFRRFREGTVALLHPRIVGIAAVQSAGYLLVAGMALYLVTLGLGVSSVSVWQVLSVYFLSLAVGLIFPLPTDIGVIEASGVGAFVALGVDRNAAIGVMLLNRALNLGSSVVIALVTMVVLRQDLRIALGMSRGATARGETRETGR